MNEPGIHDSIPAPIYHGWDACSSSRLSWLARSPAYCRWRIDNPEPPTPAQMLGSACHYAILEPEKVESVYVVAGQCEATTGKGARCGNQGGVYRGGGWYCGIRGHAPPPPPDESPEGRVVLPREDMDRVLAIRDAVRANAPASALLRRQTRREVSMLWGHEGLACKGRLDVLADDIVGDVKITRDAHPARIERFIGGGVHRQAAFYLAGLAALGRTGEDFVVVAVEPEPPHEVAVYALDPHAIRCGREHNRKLMALYESCLRSGQWPGYGEGVLPASVPMWVLREQFPEEFA